MRRKNSLAIALFWHFTQSPCAIRMFTKRRPMFGIFKKNFLNKSKILDWNLIRILIGCGLQFIDFWLSDGDFTHFRKTIFTHSSVVAFASFGCRSLLFINYACLLTVVDALYLLSEHAWCLFFSHIACSILPFVSAIPFMDYFAYAEEHNDDDDDDDDNESHHVYISSSSWCCIRREVDREYLLCWVTEAIVEYRFLSSIRPVVVDVLLLFGIVLQPIDHRPTIEQTNAMHLSFS